ncbi:MAG: prepilin peptidase [Myxococcales bacterium]|nr:prepilin peptidase [Myxococcales bacterium]
MSESWILASTQAFAVLYGLAIGSFLANAIVRIPEGRSLWVRSSCPRCATPVEWRDNVPVLSWLLLRGRCRHCSTPISPLYPLVEALTAVFAWLVCRHLFVSVHDIDAATAGAWVLQFGLLCLLIVASAVDVRHRIIPDETSVYAVPFAIAGHAVLEWLQYDGWLAVGWRGATLGAAVWGGSFAFIAGAARLVYGEEALGWGDVKLAGMLGAFLGVVGGSVSLMLGSIAGAVVGLVVWAILWRRPYLPFGPPLALGAAAYVLYGDVISVQLGWTLP